MLGDTDDRSDEEAWTAERRDFVADRRDDVADRRDADADERDRLADERDRLADQRERALDEFEQRLEGHPVAAGEGSRRAAESVDAAAARATSALLRTAAEDSRRDAADERTAAAADRSTARERRERTTTSMLAEAFAELARHLHRGADLDEVLDRIVVAAVAMVEGADMASITVRRDGTVSTVASTHDAAGVSDQAQYDAGEGPCLDAVDEPVVYAPSFPDPRWPALADEPPQSGVESIVSFQLSEAPLESGVELEGSLNVDAHEREAFDAAAREVGLILASHASVAASSAAEREHLESLGQQLHDALSSRDVIGQAKGILMERLGLKPEDAFDVLRRASQQLNVKLREVAERIAYTGEVPEPRADVG